MYAVGIAELAMKASEAKSVARRSDSSSSLSSSRSSTVESGCGGSSRFNSSIMSDDGETREAWSPPHPVRGIGGSGSETWSSLGSARSQMTEIEMMKERFARLLLGEDMTGSGKGICTALSISNAITNLYASIFGDLWRLEALPIERKEIWRREMNWFLSVSDHIVEMAPSFKTFSDGTQHEIMICKQRADLFINLPALRKLDSMLIELLDRFSDTEFWYVVQEKIDEDAGSSVSLEKALQRQNKKWWLPVPQVPKHGLSIDSKRQLHQKRECAVQVLKAAMLINVDTISEMEVPESYLVTLPKTGKACLGDQFFKFLVSDKFSIENVFYCLDLSDDHIVSELVDRLEAAISVWRKKSQSNLVQGSEESLNKFSSTESERKELLCSRAEDMLLALKQQFPHLPQTTLEAAKIQCNKDIGKAILESYSRVLESLAYNIIARIDDLLSIDALAKEPVKFSLPSTIMTPKHQTISSPYSTPFARSSARTAPASPFHPSAKPENFPIIAKPPRRSSLAKRLLANYMWADPRSKPRQSSKDDSVLAISYPTIDADYNYSPRLSSRRP